MRKKTIIMAFACFIFNYSMLFCASDHTPGMVEESNLDRQKQEMREILDATLTPFLYDAYTSPSKKVTVKRPISDPYTLFNVLTFFLKDSDAFSSFRFAKAISGSSLSPEIIKQALHMLIPHRTMFQGTANFTQAQDSKDQKNFSMGTLATGDEIVAPHDYKILESGAESKLNTRSARIALAQILSIHESELNLGLYSFQSPGFFAHLNEYLSVFWNIKDLNTTERRFFSFLNSRFSGTILATNNMFMQIPIIVDFLPKEDVTPIRISSLSTFYQVLDRLQKTQLVTMNNREIKAILENIADLLVTAKGHSGLFKTLVNNPSNIDEHIKFSTHETESPEDILIYGGYLFDIFNNIQANIERLDRKNPQATISMFKSDFDRTQTFIRQTLKVFDENIFSRFCSEQKVLFDVYTALLEKGEYDTTQPYLLVIDTYKYPCPACRIAFPRAIKVFLREFNINLNIQVNYHADYHPKEDEKDIFAMANMYAIENGVRFYKFCTPCTQRAPLKTGTPNHTPPAKAPKSGISTTDGKLETGPYSVLQRGNREEDAEEDYDLYSHFNNGYNSDEDNQDSKGEH